MKYAACTVALRVRAAPGMIQAEPEHGISMVAARAQRRCDPGHIVM
jgi:hypothetical protein